MVTCVAAEPCGFHVPVQRPSLSEVSEIAGSPVENPVTTLPWVMRVPQSSTTVTSSAVGHPADTWNPAPSCVNTGTSLAGVHADDAASLESRLAELPLPGITINTISMWRTNTSGGVVLESVNVATTWPV